MNTGKTIRQIMFHIEGYVATTSENVGQNIKLVAISSVVLATIVAMEMLEFIPVLSGLPLTTISNNFTPAPAAIIALLSIIIGSVLLLLIGSAVLHIFVIVFNRKTRFSDTVPAMVAFIVPNLLFGWIPLVNIWTSIYTFLVIVYVLAKKQNLTMAKATLAIAIPIIVLTVIAMTSSSMTKAGLLQSLVPIPL